MKIIEFKSDPPELVCLEDVVSAWVSREASPRGKLKLQFKGVSNTTYLAFESMDEANKAYHQLINAMKGQNMLKNILTDVREFISLHRNVIYWLALAFLVDHFFLNGKFREKLNSLVEKLLKKIEKQVDAAKIA